MTPSTSTSPHLRDTLRYLATLQKSGIKFGLQNIAILLASVGNPHHRFPSVHIAGTNGKGSTSSMLSAVMTAAGYRTGLYTSPHLVAFAERIRVDGIRIPDQRIVRYLDHLKPVIEKLNATFFEATTAIAMMYFAEENVDIAVIEAGLGGRLDSTNILTPLLSIITTVDYDHMDYLGTTLSSIAKEKAGIMKTSIPCLTAETKNGVLSILARRARQQRTPLLVLRELTDITVSTSGIQGNVFSLETPMHSYRRLANELPGIHQVTNAGTAVLAAEFLSKYFRISTTNIRRGLKNTRRISGLQARLQIVRRKPLTIVDVAHNPQGVRCTVDSLTRFGFKYFIVVFAVMADKDSQTMLELLKPVATILVATQLKIHRALASEKIVQRARAVGIRAIQGGTTEKALSRAVRLSKKNHAPILIIGSHYLAGEVLEKIHYTKT